MGICNTAAAGESQVKKLPTLDEDILPPKPALDGWIAMCQEDNSSDSSPSDNEPWHAH